MEDVVGIICKRAQHPHFLNAADDVATELMKGGWHPFFLVNFDQSFFRTCRRIIIISGYSSLASIMDVASNNGVEYAGIFEGSFGSLNCLRNEVDGFFKSLISPQVGELVEFVTRH